METTKPVCGGFLYDDFADPLGLGPRLRPALIRCANCGAVYEDDRRQPVGEVAIRMSEAGWGVKQPGEVLCPACWLEVVFDEVRRRRGVRA